MSKTYTLYNGEVQIDFNESNHSYWLLDPLNLTKAGTPKKKRLCGVTTYLSVIDKPALIPWAVNTTIDFLRDHLDLLKAGKMTGDQILRLAKSAAQDQKEEAANIGSAIHEWCEKYINHKIDKKNEFPDMPEDDRIKVGALAFVDWEKEHKVKFLWSEKVVFSKKFGYVGTADIGVEIEGKKYLVDIKTGNGLYPEVRLQTEAYLSALEEESGEVYSGRWALRISKETKKEYDDRIAAKNNNYNYPEYQVFEAVFLDDDPDHRVNDFNAFKNAYELSSWKKVAKL
jgi:hypothetical protein